jgi:hypothetical protein
MKSKFSASDPDTLTREIAALAGASRTALTSRWRALYDTEPPRRISRDLLTRAIAYRLQEVALSGLKPATRRLLARVAADASAQRPIALSPAPTLAPGTVLLRNWHGTEHQAIVREHGVEFQGRTVQVAVPGGAANHRQQVVGPIVLRTQTARTAGGQWLIPQ